MFRTLRWTLVALVAMSLLAACGSSSKTTTSTTSAPAVTTATTAAAPKTVGTATDSKLGAILVNSQGLTLYHNTKEKGATIVCTAACQTLWPPLTVPAGTSPTWEAGLPGAKFGTVARPDGTTQVTFNDWPLYMYSKDAKAGDANGQGVGGIWFAITSAGTNAGAAAGSSTTTGGSTTSGGSTSTTASGGTTTTVYGGY